MYKHALALYPGFRGSTATMVIITRACEMAVNKEER